MNGADYRAAPADGSAWVTGASAGLGRGVALELARRGFTVFATARRADLLEKLAAESAGLAGRILAAPGDVTDRAGIAALYAGIEAQGPVALALLNAGGGWRDKPGDFGGEAFQRTFKITYPSLYDQAGQIALSFRDIPPNAVPSTLVIDRQGKIAARAIGGVSYSPLRDIVTRLAAEK